MIVAYDYKRGEPRGYEKIDKGKTHGDCIDCNLCVKVCPTGIDIRNGVQMECVGCTACIDACNSIMDKLERPRGLIRYASENQLPKESPCIYTTRMKFYTGLCALVLCILSVILITRKDIDATIMRTPGILYQERGKDSISNLYNIKLINKAATPQHLDIRLADGNGKVEIIGKPYIAVEREGQGSGSFFVVLPNGSIHSRKTEILMELYEGDTKVASLKTNFLGPINY